MRSVCAVVFAAAFALCAPAGAQAPSSTLKLESAFAKALKSHPDLARFQYRRAALEAELEQAGLAPQLTASAQVENAAGTGAASGADQAEITLGLASILERGDKRRARIAVARSQYDAIELANEARTLDILADVARRYLEVLGAQRLEAIALDDINQRQRAVEAAAARVRAGASPDSTRLAAVAAEARARLERERVRSEFRAARQRLASSMGERTPSFEQVAGDLSSPPAAQGFDALAELLDRSPELARFADEKRVREARLQLAKTARSADWEWQLGIRRLEETDDWAAVAGVSIPLGTRTRAASAVRAADAELDALELERTADQLSLHATLAEAHAQLTSAIAEVAIADKEVLPALEQADLAAERAYRAGALSYLEWAQVQADRSSMRRERISAVMAAHRALIEIQRLTGDPFVLRTAAQ